MMNPTKRTGIIRSKDFSIDHLLIHVATVHRYTKTRIPGGGFKEAWSPVGDIDCRFTVYTPKSTVDVIEQKESFPTQYKLFTRGDADIKKGDRITYNGVVYEVVDNPLDPSFLGHHLEIAIKEVSREV